MSMPISTVNGAHCITRAFRCARCCNNARQTRNFYLQPVRGLSACLIIVITSTCRGQSSAKRLVSEMELLGGIEASKPFKEGGNNPEDKFKFGPCFNLGLVHRYSQDF